MAMDTNTGIFGVKNVVIKELLTDAAGACPTYGAEIQIPGISALKMSKKISTKESKGDEILLDTEDIFENLDISWDNEILSLEAMVAIGGLQAIKNTAGVAGTSPELSTIIEGANNIAKYFMIQFEAKRGSGNVKNVGVEIFKVKGTLDVEFTSQGFGKTSFKGTGIAVKGTIDGEVNAYRRLTLSDKEGAVTFKKITI